MKPNNKKFTTSSGKNLAQIRKQKGLSQRALGKLVGVSGRMIAYYETVFPPIYLIEPLCKALGTSADELLGFKPFKQDIDPEDFFLWKRFKKIKILSERDRKTIFSLLHAVLAKKKLRSKN